MKGKNKVQLTTYLEEIYCMVRTDTVIRHVRQAQITLQEEDIMVGAGNLTGGRYRGGCR